MGNRTLAEYTYSNDRNRQLLSLDYGNGDEVQYTYDEQGRVIQETYEDGDTVTYTYDNAGGIATVTDSSSKVKSEVMYSAEDQLSRYTETGGDHDLLVRYKYDTKERLQYILYMVDNNLASKAHNSEYTYNKDNRITSYRKGNGILAYTYDKFDRIASTQLTHKENSILNTEYTFYAHGENQTSYHVSAIAHTYTEGNLNYTYTYDANGNILSVNDGTNTTSYVYDSQNQLIRENNQAGKTSGRAPTNWNDVNDVGESVVADLKAKGYTVRTISGPNAAVDDNEFKIVLRVGTQPYAYNKNSGQLYYDYHFMRQTNTGQWAEKHGYGGPSVLWAMGMTPDTIPWTLYGVPYYDSAIIYYAVGN